MKTNFLFEIGTEEIPAHYMPNALKQMKESMNARLTESRICCEEIITAGTPRRLTVFVKGISTKQNDMNELVKGPSKKAAYDASGVPTKALEGFMRSQGITEKDIEIRQVNGVEYIYTSKTEQGRETREVLAGFLPEVINSFGFPKSMRWSDYSIRFARPIRWIVALLGSEVIEFSIEGAVSSNITRGHRTLYDGCIALKCADEYFKKLEEGHIMALPDDRRASIVNQVNELARSVGGNAVMDEELLSEVVFLVEYPTALIGSFDKEFLELPDEVVITPMREHQRYFHVVDDEGKLLPYFITIRNGNDEYIDNVRTGNERVLQARLKDAQFFYREDLKVSLESRVEKLKTVMFQEKLGTMYDKVVRLLMLSLYIGRRLPLSKAEMASLERAGLLCKTDLVTGMVNEFDELQGTMGREYALKKGEAPEIAEAIFSHYLPRYSGDRIPGDKIGQILSIADKLDTCVGIFGIGLQPNGSQDPYGLRRLCIGIINIITAGGISMNIGDLIEFSISIYADKLTEERFVLFRTVIDFFRQRLRVGLIDKGCRHDVVDAVLSMKLENIGSTAKKVSDISEALTKDACFRDLTIALTRVFNLASKTADTAVETSAFENEYERELYDVNLRIRKAVAQKIRREHFIEAVHLLYGFIDPINTFFDNTMVLAEDTAIRKNRLSLLSSITDTALIVCDFSKILVL